MVVFYGYRDNKGQLVLPFLSVPNFSPSDGVKARDAYSMG